MVRCPHTINCSVYYVWRNQMTWIDKDRTEVSVKQQCTGYDLRPSSITREYIKNSAVFLFTTELFPSSNSGSTSNQINVLLMYLHSETLRVRLLGSLASSPTSKIISSSFTKPSIHWHYQQRMPMNLANCYKILPIFTSLISIRDSHLSWNSKIIGDSWIIPFACRKISAALSSRSQSFLFFTSVKRTSLLFCDYL